MNILENIKRIRVEKKITQADISEKLGLAQNNYGNIERGITELTITRLYEIAKVLEVSINELLGESTQKTDNERVKELEGRITELEKWLKDKEVLIRYLNEELENESDLYQKALSNIFYTIILNTAFKNNIGEYTYTYDINENYEPNGKIIETKSTILSIKDYKLKDVLNDGFDFDLVSEKEQNLLFNQIIKDPLSSTIVRGFFDDVNDNYLELLAQKGSLAHLIKLLKDFAKPESHLKKGKKYIQYLRQNI